jgi:nicotinate-nucleotide adenylyltransferase
MRLGVFGGSFDPVHYGHLLLAECCREECQLDCVWFLPAAVPPHKQRRKLTGARQRVEMLELALAGHDRLAVSTLEIDRGGVSYTVDTLEAIHEREPGAQLFLPMGADSLRDFPKWHRPDRICQLAMPIVVQRADSPEVDTRVLAGVLAPEKLAEMRRFQIEMPRMDLSSTDIRQRIAAGRSIRYRTPRSVEKYIQTHGLYLQRD